MWGIVPAAGVGSRIQPLAFSKELLPVGSVHEDGVLRPRAVSEYLVDRLVLGGARKIAFVISPGKADIVAYFGGGNETTPVAYVVQPEPSGLCDALFRALPLVRAEEHVLVGLPDTIWFPDDALAELGEEDLSFLCFPVERPELFDAVDADAHGNVREVQVKDAQARTHWIWGAFKVRGRVLHELHALWCERNRSDPYVGTLVNAWLARGGKARARNAGQSYVDVGTVDGYREAVKVTGTTSGVARVANGRRTVIGAQRP
ncbi:MAG: Glucose-phosphate thymidylyltransferase [Labilithrix sp.]|nr:Glucose-phosphate thymidylyltransferase [Labilithrix sp.]